MEVPAPSVTLIRVTLRIYDTATRTLRDFEPVRAGHASVYLCGATVQTVPHIGHIRSGVAFDILRNWLEAHGLDVAFVRNVTNIDDKILTKAADNGRPWWEWAATHERAFQWAYDQLGVRPPSIEPRATGHITEMVEYMRRIIDNGHGYAADGNVYMQPTSLPDYGHLSGQKLDELDQGESAGTGKRDPRDFTMWKAAKPGEPSWPTPWGDGRPGWHIECTAMATKYLGAEFDFHCGGLDLQFPHHENEIAQSCGAHHGISGEHAPHAAHKMIDSHVKYWLHNGFIRVDNEKMSKSLGNFFTIRDVLKKYDAEVVRFFILRAHYRSPLNYSDAHLDDAKHSLTSLYNALGNVAPAAFVLSENANDYTRRFYAAMDDDFDTVKAVAVLFELAKEVNKSQSAELSGCLKALAGVLGLLQREPHEFLQSGAPDNGLSADAIEALIAQRNLARANKNWAESDRIRDELAAQGVVLRDAGGETTWTRE